VGAGVSAALGTAFAAVFEAWQASKDRDKATQSEKAATQVAIGERIKAESATVRAKEAAKKARREASRAQSLLLATRSNEVYDEKPLLALLLAVEAVRPLLKEDFNTPHLTLSESSPSRWGSDVCPKPYYLLLFVIYSRGPGQPDIHPY
jgi:hypothetical protein